MEAAWWLKGANGYVYPNANATSDRIFDCPLPPELLTDSKWECPRTIFVPNFQTVYLYLPSPSAVFWTARAAQRAGCWLIELIKRVLSANYSLLALYTHVYATDELVVRGDVAGIWTEQISETSRLIPTLDAFFQLEICSAIRNCLLTVLSGLPYELIALILCYRLPPSWQDCVAVRMPRSWMTEDVVDKPDILTVQRETGMPIWFCRDSFNSTGSAEDAIFELRDV